MTQRSAEDRTYTATDVKGAKNVLSRGRMVQVKKDIKQSTWQGNITAHRMEDENVELPECSVQLEREVEISTDLHYLCY